MSVTPVTPNTDAVLDAAKRCVERWGMAKVTIDDIAADAGVSRATLYRLFPGGKDVLYDAMRVRELEGGRYAVHRFRGGRNPEREAESLQRLQKWMVAQGMQALSEPTYGYFDPPWTPAFLRRNEVMVKTSP